VCVCVCVCVCVYVCFHKYIPRSSFFSFFKVRGNKITSHFENLLALFFFLAIYTFLFINVHL
jgi:hypothetical protein